jgi:hypothetical protein
MNRSDYYDLKGWSRDENRALNAMEEAREGLILEAWEALWWCQVEPSAENEADYRRALAKMEGDE